MNQQYVILRKENDLLNSLIGKSFNEKSKFEAYKILTEIHKKSNQHSIEKALCYIVDKGEIKSVSGSSLMKNKKTGEIVSDLILDNFGKTLATLFKKVDGGSPVIAGGVDDTGGVNRVVRGYGNNAARHFNFTGFGSLGMQVGVGQGSTVPARANFGIETPFGTAPESGNFNAVSDPVWNTALGNFKFTASIIAGGAGTITESVLFDLMLDTSDIVRTIALFRDLISPGSSFVLGQTIALEYTVQL